MTGEPPGRRAEAGESPPLDDDPYRLQHKWIRIRLIGWALIGVWQILSLISEFVPIDLERRAIRVAAKLTGLLGLILVAYGFERLAELTHKHHARVHAFHEHTGRSRGGRAE